MRNDTVDHMARFPNPSKHESDTHGTVVTSSGTTNDRLEADRNRAATVGTSRPGSDLVEVEIGQYSLSMILVVWAAAALPMAALAWLVAPSLANVLSGDGAVPMAKALLTCMTVGLVWQFVLVVILLRRERLPREWTAYRDALWLRPPRSPRTGRVSKVLWLLLVPLVLLFAAKELLPGLPMPGDRDLGTFLESNTGQDFLSGNWGWFALMGVLWLFNSVLGEELLFRGLLLPRMNGAFGRGDWVANGVLFAVYHLHMPWAIPVNLLDTFVLAYPSKRYRSAWFGIAVHSAQNVFFGVLVLGLVLS